MDMETLENFLVIARENNVTRAAQIIHITQPTLSRQLKALEEELGRPLFYRENRRLSLTPEGILFRKRAEELLDLYRKTRSEIRASTEIAGDIFLGTGETDVIRLISQVAVSFSRQHPGIRYRIFSSDAEGVRERLNKGLLDLGLVYGPSDPEKFASVPLDQEDRWGILLPRTHPLAAEPGLSPEQVRDLPLILSQQALKSGLLLKWLGKPLEELNIIGTYTLLTNAAKMVAGGLGCAMGLDGLINTAGSPLCFRPCDPPLTDRLSLIWKKDHQFSPAVQAFQELLLQNFAEK